MSSQPLHPLAPASLGQVFKRARRRLAALSESPGLDAQVLMAHVLGRDRAWVLAHPEALLREDQAQALEAALARLTRGEPLPYVLGHWEFFGLDLEVTPAVLIPRPETELLVERALAWLDSHPARRLAADVGTGSGGIAIALAGRVPGLKVIATDYSGAALQVARRNAARHALAGRVAFLQADLLSAVKAPFDLICANLPYIPQAELERLAVYGREPTLALSGGVDGLEVIRRLLADAPRLLAPGGALLMEIEANQGEAARTLAKNSFLNAAVRVNRDLAGKNRLLEVEQ